MGTYEGPAGGTPGAEIGEIYWATGRCGRVLPDTRQRDSQPKKHVRKVYARRGVGVIADLPRQAETSLILAIIQQAVADASNDIAARRWLMTPDPVCVAYCDLINLQPRALQELVRTRYGVEK